MAAERFFNNLANEVLEATERISNHFDNNLGILFGTTTGHNDGNHTDTTTTTAKSNDGTADTMPDSSGEDYMDDDFGNPLQGMADQVLNGIMNAQVPFYSCVFYTCVAIGI
jgi:hypothetical protein